MLFSITFCQRSRFHFILSFIFRTVSLLGKFNYVIRNDFLNKMMIWGGVKKKKWNKKGHFERAQKVLETFLAKKFGGMWHPSRHSGREFGTFRPELRKFARFKISTFFFFIYSPVSEENRSKSGKLIDSPFHEKRPRNASGKYITFQSDSKFFVFTFQKFRLISPQSGLT